MSVRSVEGGGGHPTERQEEIQTCDNQLSPVVTLAFPGCPSQATTMSLGKNKCDGEIRSSSTDKVFSKPPLYQCSPPGLKSVSKADIRKTRFGSREGLHQISPVPTAWTNTLQGLANNLFMNVDESKYATGMSHTSSVISVPSIEGIRASGSGSSQAEGLTKRSPPRHGKHKSSACCLEGDISGKINQSPNGNSPSRSAVKGRGDETIVSTSSSSRKALGNCDILRGMILCDGKAIDLTEKPCDVDSMLNRSKDDLSATRDSLSHARARCKSRSRSRSNSRNRKSRHPMLDLMFDQVLGILKEDNENESKSMESDIRMETPKVIANCHQCFLDEESNDCCECWFTKAHDSSLRTDSRWSLLPESATEYGNKGNTLNTQERDVSSTTVFSKSENMVMTFDNSIDDKVKSNQHDKEFKRRRVPMDTRRNSNFNSQPQNQSLVEASSNENIENSLENNFIVDNDNGEILETPVIMNERSKHRQEEARINEDPSLKGDKLGLDQTSSCNTDEKVHVLSTSWDHQSHQPRIRSQNEKLSSNVKSTKLDRSKSLGHNPLKRMRRYFVGEKDIVGSTLQRLFRSLSHSNVYVSTPMPDQSCLYSGLQMQTVDSDIPVSPSSSLVGDAHSPVYCLSFNQTPREQTSEIRQTRTGWKFSQSVKNNNGRCSQVDTLGDPIGSKRPDSCNTSTHDTVCVPKDERHVDPRNTPLEKEIQSVEGEVHEIPIRAHDNNVRLFRSNTGHSDERDEIALDISSKWEKHFDKVVAYLPGRTLSLVTLSEPANQRAAGATCLKVRSNSTNDVISVFQPEGQIKRCQSYTDLSHLFGSESFLQS